MSRITVNMPFYVEHEVPHRVQFAAFQEKVVAPIAKLVLVACVGLLIYEPVMNFLS